MKLITTSEDDTMVIQHWEMTKLLEWISNNHLSESETLYAIHVLSCQGNDDVDHLLIQNSRQKILSGAKL